MGNVIFYCTAEQNALPTNHFAAKNNLVPILSLSNSSTIPMDEIESSFVNENTNQITTYILILLQTITNRSDFQEYKKLKRMVLKLFPTLKISVHFNILILPQKSQIDQISRDTKELKRMLLKLFPALKILVHGNWREKIGRAHV